MRKFFTIILSFLSLGFFEQVYAQKKVDCFILDNRTAGTVDVYVVAKGGSFLTEQWNDFIITLSVPISGNDLGLLTPPPSNTAFNAGNTYVSKGFILVKQPTNNGTLPTFLSPTKKYFAYGFAGVVTNFQSASLLGQDATLPEDVPVLMGSIPKNGNSFSTIDIYERSEIASDPVVFNANASYYIEINNLEESGEVYKADILHLDNRLNVPAPFPAVSPNPPVLSWLSGSAVNAEPTLADAGRNLTIFQGPAIVTGIGAVDNTTFKTASNIVINPSGGFQTNTVTHSSGGNDSIIILANNLGNYGQYIGPSINGKIQQYIKSDAGWRNVALPTTALSTVDFNIGGAPINTNVNSTSYHANPATRDVCGNWGGAIGTVNVYRFTGATGSPRPHEWYGAGTVTGGTLGYSLFAGGAFTTNGFISVKGIFNAGALTYPYAHEAPHATNLDGASQSLYLGGGSCIGATGESPEDRKANWDGWALVANPYPSNLDVDAFSLTNGIDPENIRVWDRTAGTSGLYVKKNGATIPPMQAFWLKSSIAGDNFNVVFDESHRTFVNGTFTKSTDPEIVLSAINIVSSEQSSIKLRFNPLASKGYDMPFDAYALSQPGSSHPQLAFHNTYVSGPHVVVAPLDLNTVAFPNVPTDSYDLRFWARSAGNFSFSIDKNLLTPGWEVYIEDLELTPGLRHNITNSSYTFSYSPSNSSTMRFKMHFSAASVNAQELEMSHKRVFVFGNNDGVNIGFKNFPTGEYVSIEITNEIGQVLYKNDNVITDKIHTYFPSRNNGLYVVFITDKSGKVSSHKVIQ
jgi:hypothetical protein